MKWCRYYRQAFSNGVSMCIVYATETKKEKVREMFLVTVLMDAIKSNKKADEEEFDACVCFLGWILWKCKVSRASGNFAQAIHWKSLLLQGECQSEWIVNPLEATYMEIGKTEWFIMSLTDCTST